MGSAGVDVVKNKHSPIAGLGGRFLLQDDPRKIPAHYALRIRSNRTAYEEQGYKSTVLWM